jgi:hypothetical protein
MIETVMFVANSSGVTSSVFQELLPWHRAQWKLGPLAHMP